MSEVVGGRYALLRKLAEGGMAEVFLARQTGLEGFEKLVVLKRILPVHAANPDFVKMFIDEARTAADLRHPNVVSITDVGRDAGTYFIAMEYLHGVDLSQLVARSQQIGERVPLADLEPAATPEAPAPELLREEGEGAWLSILLTGVAAIVGVALGGFTLARPFLPPGWLP